MLRSLDKILAYYTRHEPSSPLPVLLNRAKHLVHADFAAIVRNLIPDELAKGFGFVQSKPASALSPVFVTPNSLGDFWQGGKLHRGDAVGLGFLQKNAHRNLMQTPDVVAGLVVDVDGRGLAALHGVNPGNTGRSARRTGVAGILASTLQ